MPGARLPMFPLGAVLFPYASMPLHIFEPRYQAMMRDCLAGDACFGVVLIERGSEVGGRDQRTAVGTRGVITKAVELDDGRWVIQVRGETVVRVEEWLPDDPYPLAMVSEPDPAPVLDETQDRTQLLADAGGRVRRARALLAEHGGAAPVAPDVTFDGGGNADVASWELCGAAPLSAYDAQRLLCVEGTAARLRLLALLMDELELDLQRMLTSE